MIAHKHAPGQYRATLWFHFEGVSLVSGAGLSAGTHSQHSVSSLNGVKSVTAYLWWDKTDNTTMCDSVYSYICIEINRQLVSVSYFPLVCPPVYWYIVTTGKSNSLQMTMKTDTMREEIIILNTNVCLCFQSVVSDSTPLLAIHIVTLQKLAKSHWILRWGFPHILQHRKRSSVEKQAGRTGSTYRMR